MALRLFLGVFPNRSFKNSIFVPLIVKKHHDKKEKNDN